MSWDKKNKKYTSKIRVNGINIWLGRYENLDDAIKAYNEASIKYHGDFGYINELKM